MSRPIVSTIQVGTVLQGDGGVSTGATILANKVSADIECDVILCHAPASTYHPFVTWIYHHESGRCYWGHYFETIEEASLDFKKRLLS
jgi:hypothetical protein